ncbi:MAG: cytochrome c biogenesis protein CcsA [Halobacteria archaeon]|nr:cytochrome c biogenesis protein CcsA [Halobacteria archaeon]
MKAGNILIGLSAVAGIVSTLLLLYDYAKETERFTKVVSVLIPVTSFGLVSALVYLTYQFVTGDYTNLYVWENSADYLGLLYKVTGVYAANEGSILLWGAIASVVSAWAMVTKGIKGKHNKLVQSISVGVVAYFAGMLLTQSPFKSIYQEFPDAPQGFVPPDGSGLNPLLIDPFIAIHPPLMFTSYSLLIVPFGIGTAHFISKVRGDGGIFDDWIGSVMRWLRVSWLFLTVAITLGGIWSYRVLGWGGFWAWDPVETAILVPWLFLTATIHSVTNYRGNREYSILAPASISVVFALTVYTTTVVRSGVFRSVHSFATGGIGMSVLILMGATTLLGFVLPTGYWFLKKDESDSDETPDEWITRSNIIHLGVLLFGLLTFVSFWGLSFPVLRDMATGIEVSVDSKYYNLWSYPLIVITVLLAGFYMDYDVEGKKKSLMGLGLFSTATVVAALISPSSQWHLAETTVNDQIVYRSIGNVSVLSAVPPAVYLSFSVVKRLLSRISTSAGRNRKLKETGITVIHVGVAVLFVSVSFTYLFTVQSSVIVDGVNNIDDAEMYNVPDSDYSINVLGYEETRTPSVEESVTSPSEVPSLRSNVTTVGGTITEVRETGNLSMGRLGDTNVWVAMRSQGVIQKGDNAVARGRILRNILPQVEAVVFTSADSYGTMANPPEGVAEPRVRSNVLNIEVYENGKYVAAGEVSQSTFTRTRMTTNNVLIDRGLMKDIYVIGSIDSGTASITIKTIPLTNQVWFGVGLLVLGMSLVLVFDPRHGLIPAFRRRKDKTPSGDKKARATDD